MKYTAQDKIIELQKRTGGARAGASKDTAYASREAAYAELATGATSGSRSAHADPISNTVLNLNNGSEMMLATEQRAI